MASEIYGFLTARVDVDEEVVRAGFDAFELGEMHIAELALIAKGGVGKRAPHAPSIYEAIDELAARCYGSR